MFSKTYGSPSYIFFIYIYFAIITKSAAGIVCENVGICYHNCRKALVDISSIV